MGAYLLEGASLSWGMATRLVHPGNDRITVNASVADAAAADAKRSAISALIGDWLDAFAEKRPPTGR